jgi:predicted adenine nucleotide alpha hydrolase (AANH) superfamily ATPase
MTFLLVTRGFNLSAPEQNHQTDENFVRKLRNVNQVLQGAVRCRRIASFRMETAADRTRSATSINMYAIFMP